MANTKISELPAASAPTGADVVPVVQGAATKRTTLDELPVSAATQAVVDAEAERAGDAEAALGTALSGHLADGSDAHDASAVSVVPSGSLSQSDVQAALAGLAVRSDSVESGRAFNLAPTAVKTANYTAVPSAYVPVDTTSGPVTITLPNTPPDQTRVGVKHIIQGGSNAVTIACAGSNVFNKTGGGTSMTMGLLNQGVLLQYAAALGVWYIQADDLPLSQLDLRYLADASATVKGLAKLSIAPASPTNPIALGANEKGAVNGVATLDATGKVPAGQVPVVRPIPAVGARSFLPNGVKLRGLNLVVKPSHPLNNSGFTGQGAWARYFEEWDWAEIKRQIDVAIAEGMNAIRQIGDVFGLKLGYYTEATYLARWQQLIEYCAANNLYVYATGGSEAHFGGQTYAEAAAYIAAYASFVNQYPNVIALDVLQEIPDTTPTRIANLKIVRDACKAANPNLKMTFSMASVNSFNTPSIVQALDPIVDYFDGHSYSTQIEAALNNFPGSGYWTSVNPKPVMIGEFGASQAQTSAQRVAQAKSVRDWIARHPSCIGCFYWAGADQDVAGAAANTFGLYTNHRTTLSNGGSPLSLPTATINVVSTAGAGTQDNPAFPASGTFELGGFTVTYTGKTATSFTGCTGGGGATWTVPDGSPIYVRRSDVSDVLRTFPERTAPLVIERALATDTAISATLGNNVLQIANLDLRFPVPMLVEIIAILDIDILTAGNVYSVQATVPGAQTMDGTTLTLPKAAGGGLIGRHTLTMSYAALMPAGYNGANFLFQIGHVTGPDTLTTALAGANNDLVFTSQEPADAATATSIAYVVAGTSTPLSVSVTGKAVTVNVATDGAGAATSTAAQVMAAVHASPAAYALLRAANAPSNDGTGVVTAMGNTNLATVVATADGVAKATNTRVKWTLHPM